VSKGGEAAAYTAGCEVEEASYHPPSVLRQAVMQQTLQLKALKYMFLQVCKFVNSVLYCLRIFNGAILTTGENGRLQNKVQQTIELLDDLQMAV
jgi:hypothetical protein